jgi:YHS domain-containing protein
MKQLSLKVFSIILVAAFYALPTCAQDHSQHQGQGKGRGSMMGEGRQQDMQTIHALFADHKKITRTVKQISNGVETVTESDDPKVQALIAEHAWAMQKRLENKQPIRQWDPLFAELFKNADKIRMEIVKTPKGVRVVETSDDAYVVKLIQSHAAGVSEFVTEGMAVMHKEHPLPEAKSETKKFLGKGDGVTTCPVTGEPVDKEVSAEINGRTAYFCCASCRDAVKKNPELYLKPQQ